MSDKKSDFGTHFYVVKKNSKKPEKVRLNWKMRKRKNRTKFGPKNKWVNAKREGFDKIKIYSNRITYKDEKGVSVPDGGNGGHEFINMVA